MSGEPVFLGARSIAELESSRRLLWPPPRPIEVVIFVRGRPHRVVCKVGIPADSHPAEG